MRKRLIHLLGGYTLEDLPSLPASLVKVSLVTELGETVPVMKVDNRKRHSAGNTVKRFFVYKDGVFWGQLINHRGK